MDPGRLGPRRGLDPHHGHVSIYMAAVVNDKSLDRPILAIAYTKALAFNIAWNPLFFGAQLTSWAMLDLVLLLAVVLWLWHRGWDNRTWSAPVADLPIRVGCWWPFPSTPTLTIGV